MMNRELSALKRMFSLNGDEIRVFRKFWIAAFWKAGLGNRLFHDFRGTAVRNMVRFEIPEMVSMMISGHKIRSVFERYNIVDSEDRKQASRTLAAYLESKFYLGTIAVFDIRKRVNSCELTT